MNEIFTRDDFTHLSTFFIASESKKLGLKIRKIDPTSKKSLLEIELNGKNHIIVGQRSPFLTFSAYYACKNKGLTKKLLQNADISTPSGAVFNKDQEDEAFLYANNLTKPLVIKPFDGLHGADVFLNVSSDEEIKEKLDKLFDANQSALIEQQITGTEYRVLASRNELLSIIKRVPANVIGDGTQTIEKLIIQKNNDPRRGDYSCALIDIDIDESLIDYIKKDDYTLETIPQKDEKIFLRATSNLSTGGDSIDVTNAAHPNMKKLAPKIIQSIPGLPFGGIDFMIDDIILDPFENGYSIIEINSSPMISMHHEPYEGKGKNVARIIINEMISDAKNN